MDLLVNKYKPKCLSDLIGNRNAITSIENLMKCGSIPHLLFTGPPGTGKTTTAKLISHTILENKNGLLELNASDDRGIDRVRTTIKDFSMKTIENCKFKLIILDECDSMTSGAQQAMRRLMEIYSESCKFILICNDFSKISEPIQSRCSILKFDKIPNSVLKTRLQEICKSENIKMTDSGMDFMIYASDGDMRQSLNILQACLINCEEITENYLIKIVGTPSPKLIKVVYDALLQKEIEEAISFFEEIWDEKYDPEDIISTFFRIAKNDENYEFIKVVGLTHLKIAKGNNSKLVFYGMFYDILQIV